MPLSSLRLDIAGTCEQGIAEWDFTEILATGDTILSSPAPVIAALPVSPAMTASSIVVSSPLVQARITVPGGVSGQVYRTTCTVQTAQGDTKVARGDFILEGTPQP